MSRPSARSAAYLPHVDGLRGLAIILVVGYHAFPGWVPGGFIGVDVFFVISGFVITRMLLPRIDANELRLREFLATRARRLLPSMILVTGASLAAGACVLYADEFEQLAGHAAASSLYSLNFLLLSQVEYFDTVAYAKPLLHLWSLAIEEQFYLAWPLLLVLIAARRWRYAPAIAALALASFVLNAHLVRFDAGAAFYLPFTRFWELAAGGCLAAVRRRPPQPSLAFLRLALGAVLLTLALALIDSGSIFPGWWALLPVFATLLLLAAGAAPGRAGRILENRPLVWLGLISYPLYLWHWPLLSFLAIVKGERAGAATSAVLVLAAVVLAWLTVEGLERGLRHRRDRTSLVLILGASLLVGAAGLGIVHHRGFPSRDPTTPGIAGTGEHDRGVVPVRYAPCTAASLRDSGKGWQAYLLCLRQQTGSPIEVAIVGDSHAEHLFPGLAEAAYPRHVASHVSFVGAPFDASEHSDQLLGRLLVDPHVRLVIVAAYWRERLRRAPDGYLQRLGAALTQLQRAGKTVIVLGDVPAFSFDPRRCKYSRLGQDTRCEEPAARALQQAARERRMLRTALPATAEFIGLVSRFCDAATCRMTDGGRLLYRDTNHLTPHGSRLIGDLLVRHPAMRRLIVPPTEERRAP